MAPVFTAKETFVVAGLMLVCGIFIGFGWGWHVAQIVASIVT